MAEGLLDIGDDNFETTLKEAGKPVLVDFWAPWCGPCRAIGPIVEELAGEMGGQVVFAKCNVDDNPVTPGKFGIRAIPTLIVFKDGEVVEQITGLVQKAKIQEALNKAL